MHCEVHLGESRSAHCAEVILSNGSLPLRTCKSMAATVLRGLPATQVLEGLNDTPAGFGYRSTMDVSH